MAMGLPINDAIQRILQSARELDESANQIAKEHDQHARNNFGQHIAAAVTSKLSRPRAVAPKAQDESFGSQIAQAVKVRLASGTRPRIAVHASSDGDEGFAQRLKEAIKKKSGAKRHKEYAERERERYEQQRHRAKGE